MEIIVDRGLHGWDAMKESAIRKLRSADYSLEEIISQPNPLLDSDDEEDDDEDEGNAALIYPQDEFRKNPAADSADRGTRDEWICRNTQLLRLTGRHPFNAEPPLGVLMSHGFLTPSSLHYVRNHGAVPKADWDSWQIEICGLVRRPAKIGMNDLVAGSRPRELPVTLVCAGNRRKEENMVKQTIGFNWGPSAISTSVWRGVRLRDVLKRCGVLSKKKGALHVCFKGADRLPGGGGSNYETSISIDVAMDPASDVLLAYMQNGKRLTPDHGFPVRVIVPGCIGGRMVKWICRIRVSTEEASGFYHYHDNRLLPSHVDAESATSQGWWFKTPYVIYELNINSVITSPAHGEVLPINSQTILNPVTVKGYAYSGGGRQVVRVEITTDGGETWMECQVNHPERPTKYGKHWCWCFWEVGVDATQLLEAKEVAVRAWDSSMNTQPKDLSWNVLGMMNNCWYRLKLSPCKSPQCGLGLRSEHPTQPGNQPGGWMSTSIPFPQPPPGKSLSTPSLTSESCHVTMAEVRRHNSKDSPWIVVEGRVYDCTHFLENHPGGTDSILINAGSDCTEEFEAIHSTKAKSMLSDYLVGDLLAEDVAQKEAEVESDVALNPKQKIPCRLVSKSSVTHDSRLFRFALPHPDKPLGLPAGKHVLLMAQIDDKLCARAYTPVSEGNAKGHLDLLVKVYEKGQMTRFLDDQFSVGDTLYVKGPTGHIEYQGSGKLGVQGERRVVKKMAMVAGGTGITPMFQLIRAVLSDPTDETEMFLIYSSRSEEDILLREEIDRMAEAHAERFRAWYVVSRKPLSEWKYSVGRVDAEILRDHLPEASDDTVAFLCGPPAMVEETCLPILKNLGYAMSSCYCF